MATGGPGPRPGAGRAGERGGSTLLTATNPIDVYIKFPPGVSLYAPQTLDTIAEVHQALEDQAGVGNVWSVETLRRWLAQKLGKNDVGTLKEYNDALPKYLVRRFVNEKQDAVIVSGRVPDKDASGLVPIVAQLNAKLDAVRAKHPGYIIEPTGLSVIAVHSSAAMINKLSRGLTVEFVFLASFIGLAFRSLPVMLASLLPGIGFHRGGGRLAAAAGRGPSTSSVIALTVSFGLGLERDDPLPEPHVARRSTRRRPGYRGRARNGSASGPR